MRKNMVISAGMIIPLIVEENPYLMLICAKKTINLKKNIVL